MLTNRLSKRAVIMKITHEIVEPGNRLPMSPIVFDVTKEYRVLENINKFNLSSQLNIMTNALN